MTTKPVAFYLPAELDPAVLPPDLREYGHCVLNHLHWRWACWTADDAGFAHVMWTYITRLIPRPAWLRVRALLTDPDRSGGPVVERDHRVVWGRKAEGCRLAPGYRRVHRALCADDRLSARLRRRAAARDGALRPVHHWLRGHLERLAFDRPRAAAAVAGLEPGGATLSAHEYRAILLAQCQRLADGEWYLVRDPYGRVHTPVTSLPRTLRPCLSAGGQPLVGADVANAQPLLAGLLSRRFIRSRGAADRLLGATFADGRDPAAHFPLGGCGPRAGEPADLTEYLRVCAG